MSETVYGRLRRKIVAVSVAALAASLAVLVLTINCVHYRQTDATLSAAMAEIGQSMDGERKVPATAGAGFEGRLDGGSDARFGEGLDEGLGGVRGLEGETPFVRGGRKSAHAQYAGRVLCVMVAADGAMSVRTRGNAEIADGEVEDLAARALATGRDDGLIDDYKFRVEKVADQTRVLFLDCTTDLESLRQLLGVSCAVAGGAFLIATLFVRRFARLALRPLEESERRQRQFVADAGHELKTPLSVIATNMDILGVDLAEQPEELEWVDSTNRQVEGMRRLVGDLIVLSKMEEPASDVQYMEVSLTELAHECVYTFDALARRQGKLLRPMIEEDVDIKGDEPAIRQLMSILVDNAIKYASGDGAIEVAVRREAASAVFATRNAWDHDVDAHELSALFDRFVRGSESRDRSGGAGGYGLGLSIGRAIAERHGARLEAAEDADGMIVFRVTFSAEPRLV